MAAADLNALALLRNASPAYVAFKLVLVSLLYMVYLGAECVSRHNFFFLLSSEETIVVITAVITKTQQEAGVARGA